MLTCKALWVVVRLDKHHMNAGHLLYVEDEVCCCGIERNPKFPKVWMVPCMQHWYPLQLTCLFNWWTAIFVVVFKNVTGFYTRSMIFWPMQQNFKLHFYVLKYLSVLLWKHIRIAWYLGRLFYIRIAIGYLCVCVWVCSSLSYLGFFLCVSLCRGRPTLLASPCSSPDKNTYHPAHCPMASKCNTKNNASVCAHLDMRV